MKKLKDILESKGHKIIANKLASSERMSTVKIPTPAERRAQIEARKKKEAEGKLNEGNNFKHESDVVNHLAKHGIFGVQGKDVDITHKGTRAVATHRGLSNSQHFGKHFVVHADGKVSTHPSYSNALDSLMKESDDEPCWKGYKMLGMKKKNGRKVPNCVKESKEHDIEVVPGRVEWMKKVESHGGKVEGNDAKHEKHGIIGSWNRNSNEGRIYHHKLKEETEVKMKTFAEFLNREIQFEEGFEIDESLILEAVPTRTELQDKVEAHRKFGNNVVSHGMKKDSAHITVVDKEGTKRTYHYTANGTRVENHGDAGGGEKKEVKKAPEEKRGRGRPAGSSGSYKRRVAEALEESGELNLDEFDLDDLVEFVLSDDVEMLDELSKSTLGSYIKKASDSQFKHGSDFKSNVDSARNSERSEHSSSGEIKKAHGTIAKHHHKESDKAYAKAAKRSHGISKAVKKLTSENVSLEDFTLDEIADFMESEDYYQLDELSKGTLARYVAAAGRDSANKEHEKNNLRNKARDIRGSGSSMQTYTANVHNDKERDGMYHATSNLAKSLENHADKLGKKSYDREKGIHRAIKKLSKG